MPGPRSSLFSRKQPGGLYIVSDINQGLGEHIFVHDSGSGDGFNPDSPVATIDAGYNLATASQGDVVHVMEGHSETLSAAAAIACDKIGVTIQGHGHGTDRPQITFDETDSTITVTAANNRIRGLDFINGKDALVVGIPVTAAHCLIEDCSFSDPSTLNTLHWITLSGAADDFKLYECVNYGTDTAGNTGFLTGAAAAHVHIRHLVSHGDFAAANIDMSAAWTDCLIEDCALENLNAVDVNIEGFSAATGWIRNCSLWIATNSQITAINTTGNLGLYENYLVNDDGEAGLLAGVPSASS